MERQAFERAVHPPPRSLLFVFSLACFLVRFLLRGGPSSSPPPFLFHYVAVCLFFFAGARCFFHFDKYAGVGSSHTPIWQ